MTNFFKTKFSRRVFNLITDNMTNEEKYSAVSLQGVVAQTSACISLDIPEDFRKYTEEKYGVVFIDIYNIWEVANFFKERINGIIIYDGIEDVNKACTAAAAYGCWALDSKLAEKAVKLGFDIKLNATKEYSSEYDAFVKCRSLLNNDYVCHQLPGNSALRDYAIAAKAPLYSENNKKELTEIYNWVKDAGAVLGWYYDEVSGVGFASEHGLMTLPSDHAKNLSFYAALPSLPQAQKPFIKREEKGKKVHYVTFILSDGDNVQVHVNSYRNHNYASEKRGSIPYGWTTSPAMYDIAPLINNWYYEHQTGNDNFLAAVSGVGYCNPALLPKTVLKKYAEITAEYMKKSGIYNTVLLMDSPEEKLIDPKETGINNIYEITKAFSEQEGIEGGFLYYGNLYRPVKTPGAVFWNKGKPFNAIRETLWNSGDKNSYMRALANKINGYVRDPSVIEGYTAINVQYWQYYFDEVIKFTEMLDDDIIVVTPQEFLEIMKENIREKTNKIHLN